MWTDARHLRPVAAARPLIDITRIHAEPAALELPRGREMAARWPEAEIVPVESHWRIPELHGDEADVRRWVRIKREALVLGVEKSLTVRPNGRSADFIAPLHSNGCAMACAYCYVPRRKGYSNPITAFTNIEQIMGTIAPHVRRQGVKPQPNQCDPHDRVYDIGENGDCSAAAVLGDDVRDLVEQLAGLPTVKASFATKLVNRDLLAWDPRGRTRVRSSLMPAAMAKLTDIRTSPIAERIAAIDDFVAAGYEVHVNFSPVIVAPGWLEAWRQLFQQIDAGIGRAARAGLACGVIMLTRNAELHEVNLGWHPRAEEVLWRPELQEPKRSENSAINVRYRAQAKRGHLDALLAVLREELPACRVRYAS